MVPPVPERKPYSTVPPAPERKACSTIPPVPERKPCLVPPVNERKPFMVPLVPERKPCSAGVEQFHSLSRHSSSPARKPGDGNPVSNLFQGISK